MFLMTYPLPRDRILMVYCPTLLQQGGSGHPHRKGKMPHLFRMCQLPKYDIENIGEMTILSTIMLPSLLLWSPYLTQAHGCSVEGPPNDFINKIFARRVHLNIHGAPKITTPGICDKSTLVCTPMMETAHPRHGIE
jgi:hypothetical protein